MQRGMIALVACLVAALLAGPGAGVLRADPLPVAGLAPQARPVGAPVITAMAKDAAWYRRALRGVQPPYPASLRFLEDQGAWHLPFIRPGMTGPYDIRHWHQKE